MRIKHIFLVISLLVLAGSDIIAQGTILFLNGKERRFSTAEVRGEYIIYTPEDKPDSWLRRADKYNVFSIIRDSTGEEILYQPDTTDGEDPPVEEVRDYIKGEQYASQTYSKPATKGTSLYVGVAGGMVGFYGLPVPIVYSTILGRINPKFPDKDFSTEQSEAFKAGYVKKARNIKIKQSLIFGGVGFTISAAWFAFVFAND